MAAPPPPSLAAGPRGSEDVLHWPPLPLCSLAAQQVPPQDPLGQVTRARLKRVKERPWNCAPRTSSSWQRTACGGRRPPRRPRRGAGLGAVGDPGPPAPGGDRPRPGPRGHGDRRTRRGLLLRAPSPGDAGRRAPERVRPRDERRCRRAPAGAARRAGEDGGRRGVQRAGEGRIQGLHQAAIARCARSARAPRPARPRAAPRGPARPGRLTAAPPPDARARQASR